MGSSVTVLLDESKLIPYRGPAPGQGASSDCRRLQVKLEFMKQERDEQLHYAVLVDEEIYASDQRLLAVRQIADRASSGSSLDKGGAALAAGLT